MILRRLLLVAGFGLGGVLLAGCGPITTSALVKQGAMWVGKEVVKKEYKEYKARHRDERGSGRTSTSR